MAVGAHNTQLAVILHGWRDDPGAGWLGWLGEKLTHAGWTVMAPQFAVDNTPQVKQWFQQLADVGECLQEADEALVIGHSLGCFMSLRLLEKTELIRPLQGLVLVSGFYDASYPEAKNFFSPEPDWKKIRAAAHQRLCIYSDDDTIVSPDRTRRLAHALDAELICLAGHGHFLGLEGLNELPELWDLLEEKVFTD